MKKRQSHGLALIELILVIFLLSALMGMGTVVYSNLARQDQLETEAQRIVAALLEAQSKTLAGYSNGGKTGLNYGIYFSADGYTVFSGPVYNPNDPDKIQLKLADRYELDPINLNSTQIVFAKVTGEVLNFDPDHNSITVSDRRIDQKKEIIINRLGVIETR